MAQAGLSPVASQGVLLCNLEASHPGNLIILILQNRKWSSARWSDLPGGYMWLSWVSESVGPLLPLISFHCWGVFTRLRQRAGENIALNFVSCSGFLYAWKKNTAHRKIQLINKFNFVSPKLRSSHIFFLKCVYLFPPFVCLWNHIL